MDHAGQRGSVRPYDEVVDAYGLTILQAPGGWSIAEGGLAQTKDGDFKVGDDAYSSLFRLVQTWRFSLSHVERLFDDMLAMLALRERLDDEMNRIGEARHEQMMQSSHCRGSDYGDALNDVWERQDAATVGASVYAGSVMLMLSGAVLRFKDDIGGKSVWTRVGPFFNGHSVGAVIEASANGFRHADEWAKATRPTAQQKRSQDVIKEALGELWDPDEPSPGRCVEILRLLSGGSFEGLAASVFSFAHNLANSMRDGATRG